MGQAWGWYPFSHSDAKDIMKWIRGDAAPVEGASLHHLAPIQTLGQRSIFDKGDRSAPGGQRGTEQQITFGPGKKLAMGKAVSPKTHQGSESNFDEFLQRFDRRRDVSNDSERDQSRNLGELNGHHKKKPGLPKASRPGRAFEANNRQDDSDILHFSTERSSDNHGGLNFGLHPDSRNQAASANDILRRRLSPSNGMQESADDIREIKDFLPRDKRNNSFDISNDPKGTADLRKGKLGSDKKRSAANRVGIDNLFTNKMIRDRDSDAWKREDENRQGSSMKKSIQYLEQDIDHFQTKPSIVKLHNKPSEAKTARTVESGMMSDEQLLNLGRASGSSDRITSQPSSGRLGGTQGNKSLKSRYLIGPLNLQKFCKVVQKACQQVIVRELLCKGKEKNNKNKIALDSIHSLMKKKFFYDGRFFFNSLKELPLIRNQMKGSLASVEEILSRARFDQLTFAFSKILKHYLFNKNALFKSSFDKMIHKIDQVKIKSKSLLKIAQISEEKIEALQRLVRKKALVESQIARRYLLEWLQACRGGCHQMERALVKLGLMAQTKNKRDLLRGYYGIKASGGRFDKLFILISRRVKLDIARQKYCLKKLSIWNRFRRGITEGGDAVRTIIVRTENSIDEHKLNTFNKLFKKQTLDNLSRLVNEKHRQDMVSFFKALKSQVSRGREASVFLQTLHSIIYGRPARKVWIELQLFLLHQRSIQKAAATTNKPDHFSPKNALRGRVVQQQGRVGKNPLFTYFEERTQRSRPDICQSSESIKQNHSSEIEILRSGIELDSRLQLNKPKLKGPLTNLERIVKSEEHFGLPKTLMRSQIARSLLTKLLSLYKKNLRLSWERILDSKTTHKISLLRSEYNTMGLKRLQKLVRSFKSRQFQQLYSQRVLSAKTTPSLNLSLVVILKVEENGLEPAPHQDDGLSGSYMFEWNSMVKSGNITTSTPSFLKLKIHAGNDRQLSCWKGASILSSMSAMKGVWVSAKVFKEDGDRALTKFSF